jgi:hypothetical protein
MLTFITTFTLIGAVAGLACGYLSYEPVRLSRRGMHHRDITARRAQSAAWGFIGAISAVILSLLVLSVAINSGVQL